MKLTNKKLLDDAISKSGYTKKHIAQRLGITTTSFYNKRMGLREFTVAEMVKLCDALNISPKDRELIFLSIE